MKSFFVVLSTLLVTQFATSKADVEQHKAKIVELFQVCKTKTGAEDTDLETLIKKEVPESKEGKCLISCMLEEAGIIKDNKIDVDGGYKLAEDLLADEPDKLAKIKEGLETCSKELGTNTGDKCEFGLKAAECAKKFGQNYFG